MSQNLSSAAVVIGTLRVNFSYAEYFYMVLHSSPVLILLTSVQHSSCKHVYFNQSGKQCGSCSDGSSSSPGSAGEG